MAFSIYYVTKESGRGPLSSLSRVCDAFTVLTLLLLRVLLRLLDKKVKHLRLDEPLDKVSSAFGLDGLVETSLLKLSRLSAA